MSQMSTEKLLDIAETAERLGVTIKTLREWDASGEFKAVRTPGGHRRYRESVVLEKMGIVSKDDAEVDLPIAVYNRVSSHEQKQKGDLERQQGRTLEYCASKSYKVEYVFAEVGSGMSDSRSKLQTMLKLARDKKISKVVVEHKDRLCRFNFSIYQTYFESHGVTVEWMEDVLQKSYESELVEDMLSLLASFSAKIYGRRSADRRKAKKKETEHEIS